MLVLSRKVGEEIVVGENIKLIVTKVASGRVHIGIEAPKDMKIIRAELNPKVDSGDSESLKSERGFASNGVRDGVRDGVLDGAIDGSSEGVGSISLAKFVRKQKRVG